MKSFSTKEKIGLDDVFKYMTQWKHEEAWTDFNVMIDHGADLVLADALVSAGAIDSTECFDWAKPYEIQVEKLARIFRKMPKQKRQALLDECFEGCRVVACKECNSVSFLHDDNHKLYPEALKQCWECESKKVSKYIWKRGVK